MNTLVTRLKDNSYFLPIGALTCALLWGSAFPAIRLSHQYFDASPLSNHIAFAGIRFTLAGLFVLIFQKKLLDTFKACPKAGLFAVTLFQVVFQYILFYWGLKLAPAVLGAIVISTGSFWWVLLAPLVDKKESISLKQFSFISLGFIGVCICLMNKRGGGNSITFAALLLVLACLCGVIAALLVRPMNKKVPVPFFTGAALFLGGAILCICVPSSTYKILQHLNWQLTLITLWLALVSSMAFSLWYYLITLYDVPRLSAYRMLIPVCGVLESIAILPQEKLDWHIISGGVLVLLCILLLEKEKKPHRKGLTR